MELTDLNTKYLVRDPLPVTDDLEMEVLQGLANPQKTLPPKLFYDQHGSLLFDQICKLDEYYPTRTENAIMQKNIDEIARLVSPNSLLIEFGSGSSKKTRLILDHFSDIAAYIPVDISRKHLYDTAQNLNRDYPKIIIIPLWADFTKPFSLPLEINDLYPKMVYFPGSTIGNFYPQQAIDFMSNVANLVGTGGGFMIGIDLIKDPDVLNLAYNDRKGVTAAFNLNILTHINRKCAADFRVDQFKHHAFYNQEAQRIEMHLISKVDQLVAVNGSVIRFAQGESILTEVSYKYTVEGFARMADQAGFEVRKVWVDSNNYFSVQYIVAK